MEITEEQLAQFHSPFDELVGVTLEEASPDRAVTRLAVGSHLHQPSGVVHGGVYATMVEGTAGVGASVWLGDRGFAVGVSNHTDFLRPVRSGALRAVAVPLQRGRRLQLWQVSVTDEQDRLVAHGSVKLANLPPEEG